MELERLLPPPEDCAALRFMWPRVLLAAMFASIGTKAGLGYIHTCAAGSRLIEGSAAFAAPVLVVALVLFVRQLWLALFVAALATLLVYALCRPYLDWVHGS